MRPGGVCGLHALRVEGRRKTRRKPEDGGVLTRRPQKRTAESLSSGRLLFENVFEKAPHRVQRLGIQKIREL